MATISNSAKLYPPQLASDAQAGLSAIQAASAAKATADGAAADATAETPIGAVGAACTIGTIYYSPAAALTSDNTNFATIRVKKRTAGGAAVTIASVTTKITDSGDWTAWKPVSLTISAGALASGDVLTYDITKSGLGVAVPAGVLSLHLA